MKRLHNTLDINVFCISNERWPFDHDHLSAESKLLVYTPSSKLVAGVFTCHTAVVTWDHILPCASKQRSCMRCNSCTLSTLSLYSLVTQFSLCYKWAEINSAVPHWGWGGGSLTSRTQRFYCEVIQGTNWKVNLLKQRRLDWQLLRNWTASFLWTGKSENSPFLHSDLDVF